jgi:MoaA/NifB/PqqE/SkfB family radical SAM enzyme
MTTERQLSLFVECYRRGEAVLPYPPVVVSIEATNRCNLRCPMCPVSQDYHKVSRGFLDQGLFAEILAQITPFRPRISMNIGGESTLHPRLPEMIGDLAAAGMAVCVDTNAAAITVPQMRGLVSSGLAEIVFCIDGDSPASYEAIRARARFDRTVANIRTFLELRRSAGVDTPRTVVKNIQCWQPGKALVFPTTYRELFADCPPDEYRVTWMDQWPGDHRDLLAEWYDPEPYLEDSYEPCMNLWKNLPISWDGRVYVCCLDLKRTTPVGDVRSDGVLGVWNAPALVEMRRRHAAGRQRDIGLCRNCNQIRRPPGDPTAGLRSARDDRFTPWAREYPGGLPNAPADGRR